MEGRRRNYIPPNLLRPRPAERNYIPVTAPAGYVTGDRRYYVQRREMESLLIENQRLTALNVSLKRELSAARKELRHLYADVEKVKAERDAEFREVYERFVDLEAEVKSIDESKAELVEVQRDLKKLRSENEELDGELNKLRCDFAKESVEWNKIPMMKAEIEAMQEENQRGREAIEEERKVYAMNTKESQAMEKYKLVMAGKVEQMKVEAVDAEKRARAMAAAEGILITGPVYGDGYGYGYGYGNHGMGYSAATLGGQNSEMGYSENAYPAPNCCLYGSSQSYQHYHHSS